MSRFRTRPAEVGERLIWPRRQAAYDRAYRRFLSGDAGRGVADYDALLRHVDELQDPASRGRVLEQSAKLLLLAGRLDAAKQRLAAAREAASASGSEARTAAVLVLTAHLEHAAGDLGALAALAADAQARLKANPAPVIQADLQSVLGLLHMARSEFEAAARRFRKAFLLSRGFGPHGRLDYLFLQSRARSAAADRGALRLGRFCVQAARRADPPALAYVAGGRFWEANAVLASTGALAAAADAYVDALEISARAGLLPARRMILTVLSDQCAQAGLFSTALGLGERAQEPAGRARLRSRAMGPRDYAVIRACLALGLRQRLTALMARIEPAPAAEAARAGEALGAILRWRHAESLGDREATRRLALEAVRRCRVHRREPSTARWPALAEIEAHLTLVRLDVEENRRQEARRRLATVEALVRGDPQLRTEADLLDARLAVAEGRADDAVALALGGWKRVRGLERPPLLLRTAAESARLFHDAFEPRRRPALARMGSRFAETAAWILGWIVARLDPRHRASYLRTPAAREAVSAAAEWGLKGSPQAVYKGARRPPLRIADLEPLERVRRMLTSGRAVGVRRTETAAQQAERREIVRALRRHGRSVPRAAQALGIPYPTLHYRMRRLGISL